MGTLMDMALAAASETTIDTGIQVRTHDDGTFSAVAYDQDGIAEFSCTAADAVTALAGLAADLYRELQDVVAGTADVTLEYGYARPMFGGDGPPDTVTRCTPDRATHTRLASPWVKLP